MTAIEQWLPVVGWEDLYEVSNRGRVRSIGRYAPYAGGEPRWRHGRVRKVFPAPKTGHLRITLCRAGKLWPRAVHQLVCEAFHGPKPSPELQVRHRNGIPSDNSPENLCWGTGTENNLDTVRHGRNPQSIKTHCANDHPYDEENTSYTKDGRVCRTCVRARNKAWREKNIEYDRARKRKGYQHV